MKKIFGDKMKDWIPAIVSIVSLIGVGWSIYMNLSIGIAKTEVAGRMQLIESEQDGAMKHVSDRFEATSKVVNTRFISIEKRVDSVESNQKNIVVMINKRFEDQQKRTQKLQEQSYETQKTILELRTPIKVIESRLQEILKDR